VAKFLNTSATNYYLEELIKNSKDRLILISPYLKLNDRIKDLLEDKNRLKIDVRVVYGKNELQPQEINWLNSLNLYEFSQINNNEMGIHISRRDDLDIYRDTYEEAQRIIRISDEVRMSLETVDFDSRQNSLQDSGAVEMSETKLSTSKMAKKYKIKTAQFLDKMLDLEYLTLIDGKIQLTNSGKRIGGELLTSPRFGEYFVWPENIDIT